MAEEPLDLAAALRDADPGADQPDVRVQADLFQAVAGEVAAVVAVEQVRQPGHGPGQVALAAGGLVQRQRGLLGGRVAEEDGVASDGAGVVVQHDGEPRPGGLLLGIEDLQVEQGVVGLPLLVRAGRGAPVHEFELVAVGRVPVVGEGPPPRVDRGDHRPDGGVAGSGQGRGRGRGR